jgi:hypothetical protein
MAGSFGFEAGLYDVSCKVGERMLLPAVREADAETLVIADGCSCREQIADLTGRAGLHIAQVLQMALRGETEPEPGRLAESGYQALGKWEPEQSMVAVVAVAGLGVLAGGGLAWALNQARRKLI